MCLLINLININLKIIRSNDFLFFPKLESNVKSFDIGVEFEKYLKITRTNGFYPFPYSIMQFLVSRTIKIVDKF